MERRAGGNLAGRLGGLAVARVGVGRDARRGLRLQRHRRPRYRREGGAHATAARGLGPGVCEKGMGVGYYAVCGWACRSDRKSVVSGKRGSVPLILAGRGFIYKQKTAYEMRISD